MHTVDKQTSVLVVDNVHSIEYKSIHISGHNFQEPLQCQYNIKTIIIFNDKVRTIHQIKVSQLNLCTNLICTSAYCLNDKNRYMRSMVHCLLEYLNGGNH